MRTINLTTYRPKRVERPMLDIKAEANAVIEKYCSLKGLQREDVINRRTDRISINIRDSLAFIAYRRVEQSGQCKTTKMRLLGDVFGIKENTMFERLAKCEAVLKIYKGEQSNLEELERLLNE